MQDKQKGKTKDFPGVTTACYVTGCIFFFVFAFLFTHPVIQ